MPYRRLPNTDAARIRAMEEALKKGKDLPPFKLAYSSRTYVKLQGFLPSFLHTYQLQRQAMSNQTRSNREFQEVLKKARLYLSHFIKVMYMAVQRGDIRKDSLEFYGITSVNGDGLTMPSLNTENDVLEWGERIIEGEARRLRAGRTPITNPTIAVVKVHFEKFKDALQFQRTMSKTTSDYTAKIANLRKEADEIIVSLWNQVEDSFSIYNEEKKRNESEKYGLVYVFRKSEREKVEEEIES
jgi:hypothetical protein